MAEAIGRAGLVRAALGPVHATPEEARADPAWAPRAVQFAIVRHPATWYASLWAHRMDERWCAISARDWFSQASIDRWAVLTKRCKSRTFPDFVRRCVDAFPDGWLSSLYDIYLTPGMRIGRFENLVSDTISILKEAGENPDEHLIRTTGPKNVRGSLPVRRARTTFSPATLQLIHDAERRTYDRFGYAVHPDGG